MIERPPIPHEKRIGARFKEAMGELSRRVKVVELPSRGGEVAGSEKSDRSIDPSVVDGNELPDRSNRSNGSNRIVSVGLAALMTLGPLPPHGIAPSPPLAIVSRQPSPWSSSESPLVDLGMELAKKILTPQLVYAAESEGKEGDTRVVEVLYETGQKDSLGKIVGILGLYGFQVVGVEGNGNNWEKIESGTLVRIRVTVPENGKITETSFPIPPYGLTLEEASLLTGNPPGILREENGYSREGLLVRLMKGGELNYLAVSGQEERPLVFYWEVGSNESLEEIVRRFNDFAERYHLQPIDVNSLRMVNPDAAPGEKIIIPTLPDQGYVVVVNTTENGGTEFPEGMKGLYPHVELISVAVDGAEGKLTDQSSVWNRLKALPEKLGGLFGGKGNEGEEDSYSQGVITPKEEKVQEETRIIIETKGPTSVGELMEVATFEANRNLPSPPPGTIWWPDIGKIEELMKKSQNLENQNVGPDTQLPSGYYVTLPLDLFELKRVKDIKEIPDRLFEAYIKVLIEAAKLGSDVAMCGGGTATTISAGGVTGASIIDRLNGFSEISDPALVGGVVITIGGMGVAYYGCSRVVRRVKKFFKNVEDKLNVTVISGVNG